MKNTDAILDAHYRAVELAKALHVSFWLRQNDPGGADYQLESARKHFALLSQFMAAIDAGDAPVALEAEMSQ